MIRYATTIIHFSVHIFACTSIYAGTVNTSWYKAMGAVNLICAVGSLHVSYDGFRMSRPCSLSFSSSFLNTELQQNCGFLPLMMMIR